MCFFIVVIPCESVRNNGFSKICGAIVIGCLTCHVAHGAPHVLGGFGYGHFLLGFST
jgi:hypothetical protein